MRKEEENYDERTKRNESTDEMTTLKFEYLAAGMIIIHMESCTAQLPAAASPVARLAHDWPTTRKCRWRLGLLLL